MILGIDFTGGTLFHIQIDEQYQESDVREVMGEHGLEDSVIQQVDGEEAEGGEVIIRTEPMRESDRNEVLDSFRERWPSISEEEILRTENVGSTVGAELRTEAILSLLVASLGMIAYISYRFEYRFALAAISAIIHDTFIVLTIFSLFQIEINTPFIAALLTIIGYSVNDTIVVFDRIRETLRLDKNLSIDETVQVSVRKTLTRSLNTSVTTLLVLSSLFILGGVTLRPFILALLLGVISGTYSSIFIASNVWALLRERLSSRLLRGKRSHA